MELKELKVRSNAPYPTITDATNNAKTVRVIKNLMSGYDSELKAVLQYFYQSSLSYKIQPEISKIFEASCSVTKIPSVSTRTERFL